MLKDDRPSDSQLSPEQKLQLFKLKEAFITYADRIKRWTEVNGRTPPPFRWDGNLQEFIWANRKQRRGGR